MNFSKKLSFQFEYFRALQNEEHQSMSNNFRAIQELGDRVVLYNINYYENLSTKTTSTGSNWLSKMIQSLTNLIL